MTKLAVKFVIKVSKLKLLLQSYFFVAYFSTANREIYSPPFEAGTSLNLNSFPINFFKRNRHLSVI